VGRLAADAPDVADEVIVDIEVGPGALIRSWTGAATWISLDIVHWVAFVGHGCEGAGEPVASLLRPGNAGGSTAAASRRGCSSGASPAAQDLPWDGRRTLVRADSGGGTHEILNWLTGRARCLLDRHGRHCPGPSGRAEDRGLCLDIGR
jgi:hypothetical protein